MLVGIRPHDLLPASPRGESKSDGQHMTSSAEAVLPVEVGFVEALGGETYAHGRLADQSVVARLEASERVVAGETIRLQIEADSLHLFVPSTGASLRVED